MNQVERPKLTTLAQDFWELRSGEQARREHPETFQIPERSERENLKRGDGVKLFFDFEIENKSGEIKRYGEKMWVIVLTRAGDFYLGVLDNQPASVEKGFLDKDSEIYFKSEHVIDIDRPPDEYLETRFGGEFIKNE